MSKTSGTLYSTVQGWMRSSLPYLSSIFDISRVEGCHHKLHPLLFSLMNSWNVLVWLECVASLSSHCPHTIVCPSFPLLRCPPSSVHPCSDYSSPCFSSHHLPGCWFSHAFAFVLPPILPTLAATKLCCPEMIQKEQKNQEGLLLNLEVTTYTPNQVEPLTYAQ